MLGTFPGVEEAEDDDDAVDTGEFAVVSGGGTERAALPLIGDEVIFAADGGQPSFVLFGLGDEEDYEGGASASVQMVGVICEGGERGAAWFAVPRSACPAKLSDRIVPARMVLQTKALSVPSCEEGDPLKRGRKAIRVVALLLSSEVYEHISLVSSDAFREADFKFQDTAGAESYPFVEALLATVRELDATRFQSAGAQQSTPERGGRRGKASTVAPTDAVRRISELEATIAELKAEVRRGGAAGASAVVPSPRPRATGASSLGAFPKAHPPSFVPGAADFLPAGLRRQAADAGLGEEEIGIFARLLRSAPPGWREPGRGRGAPGGAGRDDAGLHEGLEEAEPGGGAATSPDLPAEPVSAALVQLTRILERLTGDRRPANLDAALDGVMGGGGMTMATDGGGGLGMHGFRSGAQARLLAEKALVDKPELIYRPIEELMAKALPPGSLRRDGSAAARTWLELRSLLTDHRPSVNIAWLAAGIHECLSMEPAPTPKIGEARARCALLLVCMEQTSLDRGRWDLAWESALEATPPPYAAFGKRGATLSAGSEEAIGSAYSPIMDPRMRELHISRMRYAEETLDRRKKLVEKRGGMRTEPSLGGTDDPVKGVPQARAKPPARRPPRAEPKAGSVEAGGAAGAADKR